MKYIANPIEVDAFVITEIIHDPISLTGIAFRLNEQWDGLSDDPSSPCGGGNVLRPTPEMLARIKPAVGDYVVVQADHYVYLNPKEVFERKYRPALVEG